MYCFYLMIRSLFPYSEYNISENISFKLPKNIESL